MPSVSSSSTVASPPETSKLDGFLSGLSLLDPESHATIVAIARKETIPAGETILAEGEGGTHFFVIESGILEIVRLGPEEETEHLIATLTDANIVGEVAFLDGGPRSATVRAREDAVLWRIEPLDLLLGENGAVLYDNLRLSMAIPAVGRLRTQSDAHVASLNREIVASREKRQFGQFFIYIVLLLSIASVMTTAVLTHIGEVNIYAYEFVWGYMALVFIPSIIVARMMGMPLADLGLRREGVRASIREGLVVSAVLIVGTIGILQFSYWAGVIDPIQGLLTWAKPIPYLVSSFLQEFMARGLIQSSFQRFFNDTTGTRSVLVASVVFGMGHLHFGLVVVAVVTVSSFVFGAFYLRSLNLAGVTLVHFVAGICASALGIL